jgi:hypothetical protein
MSLLKCPLNVNYREKLKVLNYCCIIILDGNDDDEHKFRFTIIMMCVFCVSLTNDEDIIFSFIFTFMHDFFFLCLNETNEEQEKVVKKRI